MTLKALLICFMTGTCLNTVIGMDSPDPSVFGASSKVKHFKSALEMKRHGDTMSSAAEKKNWNLVWYLVYPNPVIDYTPISYSDHESYLFKRVTTLTTAYEELISQNKLDVPLCIKYRERILEELANYIKNFGNVKSQIESFNEHMIFHRYQIFDFYGQTCFQLALILNSSVQNSGQVQDCLKQAKGALEAVLEYGQKSLKLPDISGKFSTSEAVKTRLLEVQYFLISVIGTLVQLVPVSEEGPLIRQARKLCKDFNKQEQNEYFKKASETLQIMDETLKFKQLHSLPIGSKRIEEKRSKKTFQLQEEIVKLMEDQSKEENFNNPIEQIIATKQRALESLVYLKENDWAKKAVNSLVEIENEVKRCLVAQNSSATDVSLKDIYKNLGNLIGKEILISQYWKYVVPFIITGNFEEGIQRAQILKNLEINQTPDLYINRLISAVLKNLRGEHEEWLNLEAELEQKEELKQQEKKEVKEEAHQRKVETIKSYLAAQKALERGQQAQRETKKPEVGASTSLRKGHDAQGTVESESFQLDVSAVPHQQRKLEKRHRHEEADKKRHQEIDEKEKNQEENTSAISPSPRPLSKVEQRELILQSSNTSLAELYGLSSRALEVDQEIEGNTWRFTREEFKTYVTTMGCEYKAGNGIHTKASFPKAVHVTRGDTLITILNDFGGALTLPLWDKDYVPDYLKIQILEARKTLRVLKILEIQARDK